MRPRGVLVLAVWLLGSASACAGAGSGATPLGSGGGSGGAAGATSGNAASGSRGNAASGASVSGSENEQGQGTSSGAAGSGASASSGVTDATPDAGGAPGAEASVDSATSGLTDPGTDGDGNYTIGPSYSPDPANNPMGAPQGHQITFQMSSTDSAIYPGINGSFNRSVWVYVPAQYVVGTAAPFIVVQDGSFAVWFGTDVPHTPNPTGPDMAATANMPRILDNLIGAGKLPKMVAIFVDNGGGDAQGSERGLEYDTVSGKYAEFVQTEVLPRTISEVQAQLGIALTLTSDPQGRATLGGSSGGAASFSMAWWHPEYFTRVITFSGTFVDQASPENPLYPNGCWNYHDFDPWDGGAPNGLVVRAATNEPIRHWLESAQNDLGAGGSPQGHRNFNLANQRMAAQYAAKGYHYHYDYALGAGHLDGNVVAQTLPAALLYVWRGYPVD